MIRKFAKFCTFLISRNFANNFHFYFAKFRKRRSWNFAKFREINWKFRKIRNEFLVRNFAKFRIAKFRIHPTFCYWSPLLIGRELQIAMRATPRCVSLVPIGSLQVSDQDLPIMPGSYHMLCYSWWAPHCLLAPTYPCHQTRLTAKLFHKISIELRHIVPVVLTASFLATDISPSLQKYG